MIEVEFRDCGEIRMGSPFRACEVRLGGPWRPLLRGEWQDLVARSPDGRFLALVAWAVSAWGGPGFRVVVLDEERRLIFRSGRVEGCCAGVAWVEDGVAYRAWREAGEASGKFRVGRD